MNRVFSAGVVVVCALSGPVASADDPILTGMPGGLADASGTSGLITQAWNGGATGWAMYQPVPAPAADCVVNTLRVAVAGTNLPSGGEIDFAEVPSATIIAREGAPDGPVLFSESVSLDPSMFVDTGFTNTDGSRSVYALEVKFPVQTVLTTDNPVLAIVFDLDTADGLLVVVESRATTAATGYAGARYISLSAGTIIDFGATSIARFDGILAMDAFYECAPDLAAPVGALDIFDLIEFLALFDATDPGADLVEPLGTWDFFDILAYLQLFDAGC